MRRVEIVDAVKHFDHFDPLPEVVGRVFEEPTVFQHCESFDVDGGENVDYFAQAIFVFEQGETDEFLTVGFRDHGFGGHFQDVGEGCIELLIKLKHIHVEQNTRCERWE